MQEVLRKAKAPEVLEHIISGDLRDKLGTTEDGEILVGDVKNADRLAAMKLAISYGHGLPEQSVTLDPDPDGEGGMSFTLQIGDRRLDG